MRSAVGAQIGDPEPAVRQSAPSPRTAPASDRFCDGVVLVFALWTLCAHAVVAAGRGLVALLLLFAIGLAVGLAIRFRRGVLLPPADPTAFAAPADSPGPLLWVRAAGIGIAVAMVLSFALWPDVLRLWWSGVILLGVVAAVIWFREAASIAPIHPERGSELLLWGLAAAAVVVTLISHRPDTDDSFYVDVAVAAAEVPGRALLSVDTMHGIPDLPLHLPVYRVHSFELLNGAVTYVTGIPPIYSFHWLSAAFAALLVPLAHARLFRVLTPRRWLATVVTLLIILVAVGETHRWYGNFSFVRMWQGKSIFLSVFLPLIYAYALRFAVRPNVHDWTLLAAAQIAAVGASSSALWVAPASAMIALGCAARPSRQGLKSVLLGGLASAYVLGAARIARASLDGPVSMVASAAAGVYSGTSSSGQPLSEALVTVLGDSRLLLVAIAALLTAWAVAPTGLARRFAAIAPFVVWLVFLNPYTVQLLQAIFIGPSYWRALWVLPLPILMALVLASPLSFGDGSSRPWTRRATWLIVVAGFALLVPQYSGLSAENRVRLGWPALKVPRADYRWAAAVNKSVPPGSYVAVPSSIDRWIVTFPRHAYPLLVGHYLHVWPDKLSNKELLDRVEVRSFLDKPELVEASPQRFRDDLDRFQVRAVCMVNSPKAGAAQAILQQEGFSQTIYGDDYTLWVRNGPGPTVEGNRERR